MITTPRRYGVALAAVILTTAPALADVVNYHAELSAKEEVPPTGTSGTGHVTVTFDNQTRAFSYKVEYKDLTGPATAAHFHGPAPVGKNADVVVPVTGTLASPIEGKTTLTEPQAKALTDGTLYFNVHTAAHKPGEIRGQVVPGM